MSHVFAPYAWWQLTIFTVGVFAIVNLLSSLFVTSDRLAGKLLTKETHDPSTPEFVSAIAHIAGVEAQTGGSAELLNNSAKFLPTLVNDIRNAKDTITFTNFIWKEGKMSDTLIEPLKDRARNGVRVLILLDDFGARGAPKKSFEALEAAGGRVVYFRKPSFTRLTRFHKRNHRRAIVVDGAVGYMGGIAIQDAWLGDANKPDHWHDSMVRLEGPVVEYVQNAFAELWTATTGEILETRFYPRAERKNVGLTTVSIVSSPAADVQRLPVAFWYSFASARKSIHITNPYFVPPATVIHAIQDAARRGVDVRIILPSRLTDARSVRLASQSNYAPLLKAGVKIYEYQKARVHAKTFVVDGVWAVIGSANMDSRSFILNEENVVGIQDRKFAGDLERTFEEDLKDTKEITKADWDKRNYVLRLLQYGAKLFTKQF